MALKPRDTWFGYAPATIRAHKYAVRHHPKLGWRVACTVEDRESGAELTLFSPEPRPKIEAEIPDGGPFFVNEWKQVLKPVLGDEGYREVLYLGEFPDLHFRFRFRDRTFDNALADGLAAGDPWAHQEVGMMYQYDLSRNVISREIIRWEEYAAVHQTEELHTPPSHLMDAFGRARPGRRAGRFYINEHGIVFVPVAEENEVPIFVGRIDVENDSWFDKYEGDAA